MLFLSSRALKTLALAAALVAMFLTVASCSSDDGPTTPPAQENRAPAAPAIDTASGAPANGAVDFPASVTLHWTCSDADGDALTYDVHFGTDAAPAATSTGQAAASYGPIGLLTETTYYWQIVATDPDSLTTASAIWSFTTAAPAAETVSAPAAPTGPTTGEAGATLVFDVTGSSSSTSHNVEYQFNWDDGGNSSFMDGTDAGHAWASVGTYEVTARARCVTHPEIESAWSPALTVTITEAAVETVATPAAPTGPASGEALATLRYEYSSYTSSFGSSLHYRIDWGDGTTFTNWTTALYADKQWATAGTYDVKLQARSATDTDIESEWSPATTVTITAPAESINAPQMYSNLPDVAGVGDEVDFSAYTTTSNLGHDLEYRFDLGDGTISDWATGGGYSVGIAHTYDAAGTYTVRAQARCIEHTEIESEWSSSSYDHEITIDDSAETITGVALTGEEYFPFVDESQTFTGTGTSSLGHALQYMFEWGDGTTSDWGGRIQFHTYSGYDPFQVRVKARCVDHTEIESEWSAYATVQPVERMYAPTGLTGQTSVVTNTPYSYTVSGGSSAEGHDVEYQLYVSTSSSTLGEGQGWTTADNLVASFPFARRYYVKVRARCVEHLTESGVWAYLVVTATNP